MSNKLIKFPKKEKEKEYSTTSDLYSLNKQIMKQNLHPMTEEGIEKKKEPLEEWFNWIIDTYAMLLCHERRDYTIFHLYEKQNPNPPAVAAAELLTCLTNRGEVLSIDPTQDQAWEIWLKINNVPYCYYLFRYDNAVIEC